jgi:hypothetical protein
LSIGNPTIGGVVEPNNSTVNTNTALAMPNTNSVLVLGKVIGVDSFSIGTNSVADGVYSPSQLAALGYGGRFFGAGSLIVANAQAGVSLVPTNIVATIDANELNLAWPADHIGWQLQMQTNGLGTNWVNVASSTMTNMMRLPIDTQQSSMFFRLIYPPQ